MFAEREKSGKNTFNCFEMQAENEEKCSFPNSQDYLPAVHFCFDFCLSANFEWMSPLVSPQEYWAAAAAAEYSE